MGKSASLRDDWAGACLLPEEMQAEKKMRYDVATFGFKSLAFAVLGDCAAPSPPLRRAMVQAKQRSEEIQPSSQKVQAWRQTREWKHSAEWAAFHDLYQRFVEEWVMPQFGCDLLVQAEPVLRCVLPGSVAPCKPHCDADYYHDPSEVNFWVPMTHVFGVNSLWVESAPGASDFRPIEACYGQAVRFYGNRCAHFTVPNSGGSTRISFDFRVIPAALAATPVGVASSQHLRDGGYYKLQRCAQASVVRRDLQPPPPFVHDGCSVRTCKHCSELRTRDEFTVRQWRKPRATCAPCQLRIAQLTGHAACAESISKVRVLNSLV